MIVGRRTIWQKPWGYAESIVAVSAIVLVGLLLQGVVGEFSFFLLAQPVNYIVALFVLLLSVGLGLLASNNSFVRWFVGVEMSVVLVAYFALMSVVMGLMLQTAGESSTRFGFDVMTRNWAFVFLYLLILLSLGALVVRRLTRFRWRDYGFYLNHFGLWLFLVASGLGSADMERYVMYVSEGETQWRVYDDDQAVKELPLAILLNDFDMDYYPPKLAIIDKETGDLLPHDDPQFFQIDTDLPRGTLNGWQIQIDDYLHQAVRNSDSTYCEAPMPGSTPAARVTVARDGVIHSGWICGGSQAQLFMTMPLDQKTSMVMTVPDPRVFISDIEVFTQSGKHLKTRLEVNKPLSVEGWTIYQYGYDNSAGRLSSYSSFELVYDPWLMPAYMGIVILMIGSVSMVWHGKRREEANV